jgi:hypothetical protein
VIDPQGEDRVRFVHEERFSGLLVRPLLGMMGADLPRAFESFNRGLKAKVEGSRPAQTPDSPSR